MSSDIELLVQMTNLST